MTKHPENLAAWLDDELGAEEALVVSDHVERCGECRARASAYAEVSVVLAKTGVPAAVARRKWWPWAAAAAAAAVLALAVWSWPVRKAPGPELARVSKPPVAVNGPVVSKALKEQVRRRTIMPVRRKTRGPVEPAKEPAKAPDYWGPVIRVALPADELFAPGTVPAGVEIYADVTLGADGSPRELKVLP